MRAGGAEKRKAIHILSCQEDDAVEVFHDSVDVMDEWMVKADTVPEVRKSTNKHSSPGKKGTDYPHASHPRKDSWRHFTPKSRLGGRPSWGAAFPLYDRRSRIGTTSGWEQADPEDDGLLH